MCNGDRVSAGDDDKVLKPAVTAAQHADVPDAAEPCSGGWPQRQPLRSVHFAEVTKRTAMKPGSRGAASARAWRSGGCGAPCAESVPTSWSGAVALTENVALEGPP